MPAVHALTRILGCTGRRPEAARLVAAPSLAAMLWCLAFQPPTAPAQLLLTEQGVETSRKLRNRCQRALLTLHNVARIVGGLLDGKLDLTHGLDVEPPIMREPHDERC